MIRLNISAGEACDKFTILQIKSDKITDSAKLFDVRHSLAALNVAMKEGWKTTSSDDVHTMLELTEDLKKVNETLWDMEDGVRASILEENAGRPGLKPEVLLEVYKQITINNDFRALIKRKIDNVSEDIGEVKSHDGPKTE